ncbi:MAG: class B sortase [Solobacterium sp.]|nr:class B sortase [Solobacterium sp.]
MAGKTKKTRKLTKAGAMFFRVLMVLALGSALFSGWQFYRGLKEYADADEAYKELQEQEIMTQPEGTAEPGIDFAALAEINPDIRGWLRLADSVIDYPVVQTTDNEYYLTHLFSREVNRMGCIFIDYRNAPDFSDRNTAMYAHHMRNGSMFADLENYESQEWYEGHRQLELETPQGKYVLEPFAGCLMSGTSDFVWLDFTDDREFLDYAGQMIAHSTFQSDITLEPDDRIVTMVTCSYDFEDARYAWFARIRPAGAN